MTLLYFLADAFINTFGIKKPTEQARKQAALFILILTIGVLFGVAVIGYIIHIIMK